jgi:hypothetical protein
MENNRIALYTKVLQMQHEAVAHADDADRLAEAINGQRHEIERLHAADERRRQELDELRRENDRLTGLVNNRLRPRLAAVVRRLGRAAITQAGKRSRSRRGQGASAG